jgi:uncharacterized membrane protein
MHGDGETGSARGRSPSYPKGTPAFDRVVFFSDAVFAISITLVAVSIGIPVVEGAVDNQSVWDAIVAKQRNFLAFALTFFWVAFYWRANHEFTNRLAVLDGRYIASLLLYLAFIALLPIPSGTFGEYSNAVALSFFLIALAIISSLEVLLLTVAYRDRLFISRPSPAGYRKEAVSSLVPVFSALLSIPVSFVSVPLAVVFLVAFAAALGMLVDRFVRADAGT